ncbi:MAG: hypothetical protein Q9201_005713 [Fulgogasparrea decipioides]
MATYHSLPNEIVMEILSHLHRGLDDLDHSERKDLQNVRLGSSQLRDLAAPILFKRYVLDVTRSNLGNENKMIEFVMTKPKLAAHVRSLQIRFPRSVDTREMPDIILSFFRNHLIEPYDEDTGLIDDVCTFFRTSKQVKWNLPRSIFAGPLFTELLCRVSSRGRLFSNLTHIGFSHAPEQPYREISSGNRQSVRPAMYSLFHRLYQRYLKKFYNYDFYLRDVCLFSPITVTSMKLHGIHLCPDLPSYLYSIPHVRDLDFAFVTSGFDYDHKGPLFPQNAAREWQKQLSEMPRLRTLKLALEGNWDAISEIIQTERFFPCFDEMFPISRQLEFLEVSNWPLRLTSLLSEFDPKGSGKEKAHPDDIPRVVVLGGPFAFLESPEGRKKLKIRDVLIYCHRTVKESRADTVGWDDFHGNYIAQAFSDARYLIWNARILDRDAFMRQARRSMPRLLSKDCQAFIEGMLKGFYEAYKARDVASEYGAHIHLDEAPGGS